MRIAPVAWTPFLLLAACTGSKPDSSGDDTGPAGDGGGPVDADMDGFPAEEDCDDGDPDIHPGADEVCGDGVDRDCDGMPAGCTGVMPASAMAGVVEGDENTILTGTAVVAVEGWTSDGSPTVLVAAPFSIVDPGTTAERLYAGSVFGMGSSDMEGNSPVAEAARWRLDGPQERLEFGHAMSVGDLDGDGTQDLQVSAPEAMADTTNRGSIWLISGPVSSTTSLEALGAVQIQSETDWEGVGWGLDFSQDATGDGAPDLITTWTGGCSTRGGPGGFYVLHDRLDIDRPLDANDPRYDVPEMCWSDGDDLVVFDLDGDGIDDAVLGAKFGGSTLTKTSGGYTLETVGPGFVYVQLGPLLSGGSLADADSILVGPEDSSLFGRAVATGGDLDGDGGPDLLLGAPWADETANEAGKAWAVSGALAAAGARTPGEAAFATFLGDHREDLAMGYGLSTGGDMDGDGSLEVLVVARAEEKGSTYSGRGEVHVFRGPVSGTLAPDDAILRVDGNHENDHLGYLNSSGGLAFGGFDLNVDGFDDIVIGAEFMDDGQTGAAYLLYGGAWD